MAKTTVTPTAAQIEALRRFLDKPCYGHGAFYGITRQLWKAGYLVIAWTGPKDWTLSISTKGRRVLEVVAS